MEQLGQFSAWDPGRRAPSKAERAAWQRERQRREVEAGYRQLAELCRLGETAAARRLAQRNPHWGYAIADGEVIAASEAPY
ncbi:MAG: hypothetical protein BRC58_04740 [Cyanobacteria bacterium QS_8_64_29]|nr:MAG: hypothetical protein BRC58_04740 [Cyanobacteria bacterium QS_8_64_29]